MFGCSVFGEAYFGDACFEPTAPALPLRVGGNPASYPLPRRRVAEKRPEREQPDDLALMLLLGYFE